MARKVSISPAPKLVARDGGPQTVGPHMDPTWYFFSSKIVSLRLQVPMCRPPYGSESKLNPGGKGPSTKLELELELDFELDLKLDLIGMDLELHLRVL